MADEVDGADHHEAEEGSFPCAFLHGAGGEDEVGRAGRSNDFKREDEHRKRRRGHGAAVEQRNPRVVKIAEQPCVPEHVPEDENDERRDERFKKGGGGGGHMRESIRLCARARVEKRSGRHHLSSVSPVLAPALALALALLCYCFLMSARLLRLCGILLVFAAVVWLCAFKIADFDFWWHIKAGEIMWKTHALISTDPFAYTRAGLPYLATHEWLAQIILFLVWHTGGATGVILFRTLIVLTIAALLLSRNIRDIWFSAPLTILAVALALPGFVDRPQLFTFALFTGFFVLALRYLNLADDDTRSSRKILIVLLVMEILWVNLHGGAALMGLIIFAALFFQRLITLRTFRSSEIRLLLLAGTGMCLSLLVSPSGIGNITYIWSLLNDQTVGFIREWAPRALGPYLRDLTLPALLALGSIAATRRHVVFAVSTLIVFGILSRLAFRHEMLFIFTATAITLMEIRWNERVRAWTEQLLARPALAAGVLFILSLGSGFIAIQKSDALTAPDTLRGYGTFEPAKDSFDFLERQKISGHGFNTYDIGDYLEYRGTPLRSVFMDGRNIDFGYAFLSTAFSAAQNPEVWKQLEDRYDFTYAVISYDPFTDVRPFPYIGHLEKNPQWALVYLDDWIAVYLKDTPLNHAAFGQYRFRVLTPEMLESGTVPDQIAPEEIAVLERELLRIMNGSEGSFKAHILLANLYEAGNLLQDRAAVLRNMQKRWSKRYRTLEIR